MTAIEAAPPNTSWAGRHSNALSGARLAARLVATFVCHVTFWLAVWALGPTLFGWQAVTLVSGSMSPVLTFGDVVVAQPYDGGTLGPGTVVVFHAPGTGQLMTHRVVGIGEDGSYQTKGDANAAPDSTPLPPSEIVAVGRLRVPLIGLVVAWWAEGAYLPLAGTLILLGIATFVWDDGRSAADEAVIHRPATRRRRLARVAVALVVSLTVAGHLSSAAFGDTTANGVNTAAASRIFPAMHVTSGFDVQDASSGAVVDRSSPFAVAGDLRTVSTKAWTTGFTSSRYLQFDLSAPLPDGLAVSAPSLRITFASTGASTACVYIEIRRISTDALLATYGSAGSPAGCVTGTTLTTIVQPVPVVASTDLVNDLRVRVLGRESGSLGMVVDEARFSGSTPYMGFSTYPVRFTDAADEVPLTTPWDLQGP